MKRLFREFWAEARYRQVKLWNRSGVRLSGEHGKDKRGVGETVNQGILCRYRSVQLWIKSGVRLSGDYGKDKWGVGEKVEEGISG